MRPRLALMCVMVLAELSVRGIKQCSAQTAANPGTQQTGAVLSRLSPPAYPRLAQQAHIEGYVDLVLRVRRDGSVESAAFVSGHPILMRAALDSARQSQFECHGCSEEITSYSLTYKFQIAPRDPPKNCHGDPDPPPPEPEVDLTHHQVAVSAWQMWTCDPAVEIHRFRAAKCLYLWSCGVHERSLDY